VTGFTVVTGVIWVAGAEGTTGLAVTTGVIAGTGAPVTTGISPANASDIINKVQQRNGRCLVFMYNLQILALVDLDSELVRETNKSYPNFRKQ
jgi:hypothetical protein